MSGASQRHDREKRQENPEHPLRDARECGGGVFLIAVGRQAGDERCEDRIERLVYFAQTARRLRRPRRKCRAWQRHAGRAPDKTSQHDDIEPNDNALSKS